VRCNPTFCLYPGVVPAARRRSSRGSTATGGEQNQAEFGAPRIGVLQKRLVVNILDASAKPSHFRLALSAGFGPLISGPGYPPSNNP
jgi:hypothetical protein